ncbi:MAG: hypothetical protein QOI75_2606, partial [Pseudonocardiales bacterium]|nr:hypothetical protein [Pseudonocardiales bacterium]
PVTGSGPFEISVRMRNFMRHLVS